MEQSLLDLILSMGDRRGGGDVWEDGVLLALSPLLLNFVTSYSYFPSNRRIWVTLLIDERLFRICFGSPDINLLECVFKSG